MATSLSPAAIVQLGWAGVNDLREGRSRALPAAGAGERRNAMRPRVPIRSHLDRVFEGAIRVRGYDRNPDRLTHYTTIAICQYVKTRTR
jgi:hypothetical protein